MKRMPDNSWTLAQFNTLNPFKMGTTIPNYQNVVVPCAPPPVPKQADAAPAELRQAAIFTPQSYQDPSTGQSTAGNTFGLGRFLQYVLMLVLPVDISIYTGDSNFNFVSAQNFKTGLLETSVTGGDLRNSGNIDAVVSDFELSSDSDNGAVSVLLNNGDNTFANPVHYTAGNGPINVVVGDVNGDGKPDIVTADNNGNTVSVLLGNGDGTFQSAVSYPTPLSPQGVLLADFNGDGKLDIAVSDANGGVDVLLNAGNGTFKPYVTSSANGPKLWYMAAYDFDGDGKMDIAGNTLFQPELVVLHGNGDGTFTQTGRYAVDINPTGLIVTDFNNDGIADLVVASGNSGVLGPDFGHGNMTVLLGNGDGTFRAPQIYRAGNDTAAVVAGDFNKDGKQDLIAANVFTGDITYLRGTGGGSFAAGVSIPMSPDGSQFGAVAVATADLNRDGNPDIIAGDSFNPRIVVALGNGDGTFGAPQATTVTGGSVSQLVTADLNGDGKPDVVAAGASGASGAAGGVTVLLGNGSGGFAPATTPLTGINATSVALADLKGDGKVDIAAIDGGDQFSTPQVPGSLTILLGNGDGTFKAQPKMNIGATPSEPLYVAAGDVNGDGQPDLVVAFVSGFSYGIQVLLNQGGGNFKALAPMTTDFGPTSVVIHDFSGDGKADLVISHCCGDTDMTYMLGNGDGTFQPETHFSAGPSPDGMVLADLNGDGVPDIAVANDTEPGGVTVLLSAVPQLLNKSAASFAVGPLAVASIVAAFGSDLATKPDQPKQLPLPTSFDGTTVTVKDSSGASNLAPLFYISPGQVNYEIPENAATGPATVTIQSGDGTTSSTALQLVSVSPGIFALNPNGLVAAIPIRVASSGTQTPEKVYSISNGQIVANPIDLGVSAGDTIVLEIFGTGIRAAGKANVAVTIGGVSAHVSYAGPAPGNVGEDQINVTVPTSLAGKGNVPIVVTASGQMANTTNVTFQ